MPSDDPHFPKHLVNAAIVPAAAHIAPAIITIMVTVINVTVLIQMHKIFLVLDARNP